MLQYVVSGRCYGCVQRLNEVVAPSDDPCVPDGLGSQHSYDALRGPSCPLRSIAVAARGFQRLVAEKELLRTSGILIVKMCSLGSRCRSNELWCSTLDE